MAAPTVSDPKSSDSSPARYHLVVLGPEGALPLLLPEAGVLTIGRDEAADVRVIDPRASRHHARLHVGAELAIEDLGSANGTRLRDQRLPPRALVPLAIGDAVAIGDTVLLVQRREPGFEARRVWAHGYLETRLIEECARAHSRDAHFALCRLHVDAAAPAPKVERVVADVLRPGDLLAAYGPSEYEALLLDSEEATSKQLVDAMVAALAEQHIAARAGIACYPGDGTSPQALVTRANERVRGGGTSPGPPGVVVESRAMRELYALAQRAAAGASNVLIVGETGSGKEVMAETVHRLSPRADQPFLPLNCAAFGESLVESELFGFERGAFTGATQTKVGLLEAAGGGTVFLDEIGEMSLSIQAKLLRAIETRQVLRIGAVKPRPIDVRFVAATNRDLEEEVAEKRFRQDLFFRLNVICLEIPPLRERPEEIETLARLFLKNLAPAGHPPLALSPEALAQLHGYAWPGNIRELRNVIERASLLCAGTTITVEHLPGEKMRRGASPAAGATDSYAAPALEAPPPAPGPVRDLRQIEHDAMVDALGRCHGNQTRAAELLGMPRRTFCKRMAAYGIPRPRA